ncbi:hypothetical protein [Roseivivax sp. CAU 1753]
MQHHPRGTAPNYTVPALVMGAINLFWILGVIWVLFGLPVVLALSWVMKALLDRIAERRHG